ncbi:MAG TPA: hypothetical protein PK728_01170 [Bacillota bacterium]|nr:hypothetical protein [Bacillota bacterium]
MQWHGLKIQIIILSLLVGIAIIFGIQRLYNKYAVQDPLNAVLSQSDAVQSFQVTREKRVIKVSVTLNYNADIMEDYNEIKNEISRALGSRPFTISLNDSRDEALKRVWYKSQYAVYQSLVQGNYRDMAEAVGREARTEGAESTVYVDRENIYIRLKHQGKTLDEIIPVDMSRLKSSAGGGSIVQGD